MVKYITLYCNLALASRCYLNGSCMHSEDFFYGTYCLCKHEIMWMELEDVKYHCIALHYYLLHTYNVAARISDVFFTSLVF
jgi:hypothetical protein